MNVLLVSPKACTGGLESLRKGNQILQGLLYVASAARLAGHKAIVVVADKHDVDKFIKRYQPDLIGVSCVSSTYPVARDLLIHVKKRHPLIKTIIGGHHATFMYREVFADTAVDYVCRGEGEDVFPQLLAALEKGDAQPAIPGIVFCKDGLFYNDNCIALMADIESMPAITRDLVAPEFSFSPKIVSSRGCPFNCSFCSISAFYGGRYRKRSVEAVIADIKEYLSWGYNNFWFHDDNLTVDTDWMLRFCQAVEAGKIIFRFNCMSRVDTICNNPDLMARMSRIGCALLSIGIESGIPEVLQRMHKKIEISQIRKAVKILNKNSISHNWYMILGSADEFDTPYYLEKNIRFFRNLPLGYVLISILTPFPGTELFNKLKAENRLRHYNWEDYDVMHCVYEPLGISYSGLEKYLPKAYLSIYLGKGWRLVPLLLNSFKRKAINPMQIVYAGKALFSHAVLGRDFMATLKKKQK